MTDPYLYDTSFTLHKIPHHSSIKLAQFLRRSTSTHFSTSLTPFSTQLTTYLEAQTPQYRDDLNDETERIGILKECRISPLQLSPRATPDVATQDLVGLVFEVLYHKVTHRAIFITCASRHSSRTLDHVVASLHDERGRNGNTVLVLAKCPAPHLKRITSFLAQQLRIDEDIAPTSVSLPSSTVLKTCTVLLATLQRTWTGEAGGGGGGAAEVNDALRLAVLRQALGTLKLTVAISAAAGEGKVAPSLKVVELDVPSETVAQILAHDNGEVGAGGAEGFMERLQAHLFEKTGLRLPLTVATMDDASRSDGREAANGNTAAEGELAVAASPFCVTKIMTASLAISTDPARLKLASKVIEQGEVSGYNGDVVKFGYARILSTIWSECSRRDELG